MLNIWQGRNDGDSPLHHRIFQRVEIAENYENILYNQGSLVASEVYIDGRIINCNQ